MLFEKIKPVKPEQLVDFSLQNKLDIVFLHQGKWDYICIVKKRKIISLFHLGIKVGYLFITRKIVTRSDIGNSYDLVSKTYQQEYLKIMHTYNDILLNHLIKHISKGRILDLAGGTGYNSNFIQEYNDYSIDLVDISKQMLKQCQNSSINKVCKGMLEFLTVQESCCYDAIVCTWH